MKVLEAMLLVVLLGICLRGCVDKIGNGEATGRTFRDWHDEFLVGYNYKK